MGSSREARHAGIRQAMNGTDNNVIITPEKTTGSRGFVPKSMDWIIRVAGWAGAFLSGKDAQRITDKNVRIRLSTSPSGKELPALVVQLARTLRVLDDRTESAEALLSGFFAEWDSSTSSSL
jgi:hypothetical protein